MGKIDHQKQLDYKENLHYHRSNANMSCHHRRRHNNSIRRISMLTLALLGNVVITMAAAVVFVAVAVDMNGLEPVARSYGETSSSFGNALPFAFVSSFVPKIQVRYRYSRHHLYRPNNQLYRQEICSAILVSMGPNRPKMPTTSANRRATMQDCVIQYSTKECIHENRNSPRLSAQIRTHTKDCCSVATCNSKKWLSNCDTIRPKATTVSIFWFVVFLVLFPLPLPVPASSFHPNHHHHKQQQLSLSQPAYALKERNEVLCGTGFFTNIAQYMCTDIGDISDERGSGRSLNQQEIASTDSLMDKLSISTTSSTSSTSSSVRSEPLLPPPSSSGLSPARIGSGEE